MRINVCQKIQQNFAFIAFKEIAPRSFVKNTLINVQMMVNAERLH